MKKKYYRFLLLFIIVAVAFIIFVNTNNTNDGNVLKCHNSESGIGDNATKTSYDIYFYFDENNQKVIKEKIIYEEEINEDNLGSYAEDIEAYYNSTYCESVFNDHSSCLVTASEDKVTVEVIYQSNNLSKNILTYNNMPKEQVKKYIENAKVFECN